MQTIDASRRNPWRYQNADLTERLVSPTTLPAVLAGHAGTAVAARPALSWYEHGCRASAWSYADLIADVWAVAAVLRNEYRVRHGDRVVVLSSNCPQAYIAYLAILALGAIAVPVSNTESVAVLRGIVDQVEPTVLLAGIAVSAELQTVLRERGGVDATELLAAARLGPAAGAPQPDVAADDCAVILFTSGTTSTPKGVCLSHYNLLVNAEGLKRAHALDVHHNHLCILPLFHANAFGFSMIASVYAGCHVVLNHRVADPDIWAIMRKESIHVLSAVPEILRLMGMRQLPPGTVTALRYVVSAAAPLSRAVASAFERNTGVPIHQGYGLSECTNFAATMPADIGADVRARLMSDWAVPSIGPALFGTEVRIVDPAMQELPAGAEGEVLVAGHNVMSGYWQAPDATRTAFRGGWLHTGDVGFFAEIDDRRYFFISGRLKEIVIRHGESLSPLAIEKELQQLAACGRYAVCGFANDAAGEEIGVYVQATPGAQTLRDVREALMLCTPRYRPRVALVGTAPIPATVTGKIRRTMLARRFDAFAHAAFGLKPQVIPVDPDSESGAMPDA